jgi:hypothetical protein
VESVTNRLLLLEKTVAGRTFVEGSMIQINFGKGEICVDEYSEGCEQVIINDRRDRGNRGLGQSLNSIIVGLKRVHCWTIADLLENADDRVFRFHGWQVRSLANVLDRLPTGSIFQCFDDFIFDRNFDPSHTLRIVLGLTCNHFAEPFKSFRQTISREYVGAENCLC